MANESEQAKQVSIGKVYLKAISLRSPRAPEVFMTGTDIARQLNVRSTHAVIDAERVEVTLNLGAKGVVGDDTVFLVEVAQAGIFVITGYSDIERVEILGRICPEQLFPFARIAIADATRRGGFPSAIVNPLNFDALFARNMQERAAQRSSSQDSERR